MCIYQSIYHISNIIIIMHYNQCTLTYMVLLLTSLYANDICAKIAVHPDTLSMFVVVVFCHVTVHQSISSHLFICSNTSVHRMIYET